MRTIFLDCGMGAAGDMLTAALLELVEDKAAFTARLNALGLPGVRYTAEPSVKCGVTGTHMRVTVNGAEEDVFDAGHDHEHSHGHDHEHDHEHSHEHSHEQEHVHQHVHTGMAEIRALLSALPLSEPVRANALAVYARIAAAESAVHGVPVEQIHFHEVGSMDAVADVTAVCLLMEELHPDQVLASPVHVGSGQVRCAHGLLPVPAPATALLLQGVPIYGGSVQGELCTPTGAALLRQFVTAFGDLPPLRVEKIGYGMGKKDFAAANCVRALLGETEARSGQVAELCCNLDDMTPEAVAFAAERLFEAGALDVSTAPIGMKKGRSGVLLTCMCELSRREEFLRLLFLHTTTLGVREYRCDRYTLRRSTRTAETPDGPVRIKTAEGWGVQREKAEYEDLAAIARAKGSSLSDVRKSIK